MNEDYQKALQNLTLFFLSNPISFNEQDHEKQKGPETSDQSLIRSNSKIQINPLISDV